MVEIPKLTCDNFIIFRQILFVDTPYFILNLTFILKILNFNHKKLFKIKDRSFFSFLPYCSVYNGNSLIGAPKL